MKLLIKGGRVIDPANGVDAVSDILVENGKIKKVAPHIKSASDSSIDAIGKIVIPGLVDMHVHLREPGREDKETVATATKAAVKGGVTSVLAMPNTNPCMDSDSAVVFLKEILKQDARSHVYICGALTVDRAGKELVAAAALKRLGVLALSDDGSAVDDVKILRSAFRMAKKNKIAVICHCEDKILSRAGVMNLGFVSTCLGLKGISKESEFLRIQRDIKLAELEKAALHIAHVSCKESVEVIAAAKKRGVHVTAETAPHYFALTEESLRTYDTYMKMNPPLRSFEDRQAIREGLKNGVIDAIASDHAPHTENEKDIEFDRAEFGVIGLETELAVGITELIVPGILDWNMFIGKISLNPSRILGIDKGTLGEGKIADICIVDPRKEWIVKKQGFVSKSRNSAFIGRTLKGEVAYTICAGKVVYAKK